MATVLHLIAHPNPDHSRTVRIAREFIKAYQEHHPEDSILTLDLYRENIPLLGAAHITAMFAPDKGSLGGKEKEAWGEIMRRIEQFKGCDKFVVTSPMWNFSVPPLLRNYIDHVSQAGHTFRYTEKGPIGLMNHQPLAIINTRGGRYSEPPTDQFELCVRYIRSIFGFLGLRPAVEIVAEGIDMVGPEEREKMLEEAIRKAREAAKTF
ncbi:MAG: FMN-dependent NADH-azoreductase [Bacteroidota bacterium]